MQQPISDHSLLLRNLPAYISFANLKKAGDDFRETKNVYVVLPPRMLQTSSKSTFALIDFGSSTSMNNAHLEWALKCPECFGPAASVQADARGKTFFKLSHGLYQWWVTHRRLPNLAIPAGNSWRAPVPSRHGPYVAGRPPPRNAQAHATPPSLLQRSALTSHHGTANVSTASVPEFESRDVRLSCAERQRCERLRQDELRSRYVGPEQLHPSSAHPGSSRDWDERRDRFGERRGDSRLLSSAGEDGRLGFREKVTRGYQRNQLSNSRVSDYPTVADDNRERPIERHREVRYPANEQRHGYQRETRRDWDDGYDSRRPRQVEEEPAPREVSRCEPIEQQPKQILPTANEERLYSVQVFYSDDEKERAGRPDLPQSEVSDFFQRISDCVSPGAKAVLAVPTGNGFSCGFESQRVRDTVWSQCFEERDRDRSSSTADVKNGAGLCINISGFAMHLTWGSLIHPPGAPRTASASTLTPSRGASTPPSNHAPSLSSHERQSPSDAQRAHQNMSGRSMGADVTTRQPVVATAAAIMSGSTFSMERSGAHSSPSASEVQAGRKPMVSKSGLSHGTVRHAASPLPSLPSSSPPEPPAPIKPPAGNPPRNPPRKARSLRFSAREHGEELAYIYEQLCADLVMQLMTRWQPVLNRASADSVRTGKRNAELQSLKRKEADAKQRYDAAAKQRDDAAAKQPEDGMTEYMLTYGSEVRQNRSPSVDVDERDGDLAEATDDDVQAAVFPSDPEIDDSSDVRNEHKVCEESEDDGEYCAVKWESRRKKRERSTRKRSRKVLDSDGEEISDGESDAALDGLVVGAGRDRQHGVDNSHAAVEQFSVEPNTVKAKKRYAISKSLKNDRQNRQKKRKTLEVESDHLSNGSGDVPDDDIDFEEKDGAVSPSTVLDDADSPSVEEPSFEQRDGNYESAKHFAPSEEQIAKADVVNEGKQEEVQGIDSICDDTLDVEGSCARIAGFMKSQLRKSKAAVLPDELEMQLQARVKDAIQQAEAVGKSARGNRSAVRKLRQGLNEASLGAETMAMSYLSQRQKRMTFAKSRIHGMGLYSLEDIPAGEFLIEYVGEVIRRPLSDCREKGYAQVGMGDSYLFRLTTELVVDATRKGSIARFINHSCEPSVEARIIIVNGSPKIVFYTKRAVKCGEELTYDYQFAFEDEESKLACFCGAPTCRKSLN